MRVAYTPGTRDSYTHLILKWLWWSLCLCFTRLRVFSELKLPLVVFPESTESQKSADISRPGLELRIRQAIGKQNHLGRKGLSTEICWDIKTFKSLKVDKELRASHSYPMLDSCPRKPWRSHELTILAQCKQEVKAKTKLCCKRLV